MNPALINKNEADNNDLYKNGWINRSLTPTELAAEINKGVAYTCELSGARNTDNFVCSDILSVDIDGTWTIPDAMADPFVERHLTILYTTPSHTDASHRFRLIFALPRSIDTPQDMRAALRSVALKLGGDRSATDPARIFFGSSDSNPEIFDRGLSSEALDELIAHGLQSDQRDISAPGYTTTVSKQPIAAERMITLATGETRPFGDLESGTRVCCPFHHDTNASAFVTASKTGVTGIHCSTCAQTFWPPNTATTDDFADFDNRVIEAEKYFSENEDMGAFQKFLTGEGHQYHPGLARSHILRQQNQFIQLPTPVPKGLVFVKSPKGTGKTEELRRMLFKGDGKRDDSLESLLEDNHPSNVDEADLIPGDESVLLIGHRIALIRQSCLRLGLECYLDFEGSLPNKRLGICLDSLHRLTWRQHVSTYRTEQKENLFQTIIIDESEQVLSHFLSDTIDPIRRDSLFKIFASLLQHSKRVLALDADLGWLTFETLSKLAQPRDEKPTKRSTLVTNDRTTASPIQIFKSKAHLIGDLHRSVEDGQRVFVTSNSLNQVTKLYEGLIADAESNLRCILVTSETMASDEVKAFVGNAKERALDYDVILTSPSLGTGVDITFPDQEQLIDVVYGIFESGITTHFDFDQQIWRVRHPGAVKVWISPRKFSFDTATDVVKRDIQQKQLYKSVLSDYDENLTPEYHTNDPLIDMAVLARSQQLLSKNNLKRNFIAMKRRHGHTIDLIDKDDGLADDGNTLEAEGRLAVDAKYRERLFVAPLLTRDAFEELEQRIQDNEDVSLSERHSLARTRIELFYRQPLSNQLIDIDDKGRFRQKVSRFEQIVHYTAHARANSFKVEREKSQEYSQRLRFVRDWRNVGGLLFDLFSESGIFFEGRFEAGRSFDLIGLQPFMNRAIHLKPLIENLLDVEVRKKVEAGVTQLNTLLGLVGLQTEFVDKTKAKSVAGGRLIYRYCIVSDSLKLVEALVIRRATTDMWKYLNEAHAASAE